MLKLLMEVCDGCPVRSLSIPTCLFVEAADYIVSTPFENNVGDKQAMSACQVHLKTDTS